MRFNQYLKVPSQSISSFAAAGRRAFKTALLVSAGTLCMLQLNPAVAQSDFPSRRITMIVAFPPGGGVDNVARLVANQLSISLKQPVVVENRAGAGGNIAAGAVANAAPDGYTILFTAHAGLVIAKAAKTLLAFDPFKDLTPVAFLATSIVGVVVNPNLPVKNFQEFIAYAKRNPGKLNFGTNGVGTSYHLGLEKIKADAGVDIVHVPYQGGAPSMTAVMGGQIDAIFASVTQSLPQIKAGKLKLIALASNRKTALFPDVGTIAESGLLPEYDQSSNLSVFVPAATPPQIVAKLNEEINKAMQLPAMKKQLDAEGVIFPGVMSPKEFAAILAKDVADTESLIKRAKLDLK